MLTAANVCLQSVGSALVFSPVFAKTVFNTAFQFTVFNTAFTQNPRTLYAHFNTHRANFILTYCF